MSEGERLLKLKENIKLVKLKEDINVVTEELLEEDESDIIYINNLINDAATIMTQTMNEPSKSSKNGKNENFWKIRRQRQKRKRRKQVLIIAETGTGSENEQMNKSKKRGRIFKNIVTNHRGVAQLIEILKHKVQAKAQRIRRYGKKERKKERKKGNPLYPE